MTIPAERKRFSIDLPENWQDYLAQTAKTYKISQGEVVEILMINMHKCVGIEDALRARRDEKITTRAAKRVVKSAFSNLSPDQQKAVLAAAGAL